MILDFLSHFAKFIILYFCIGYSYSKIINIKLSFLKIFIHSFLLSISTCIFQNMFSSILVYIMHNLIYNIILSKMSKNPFGYSLLLIIISICLSTIMFTVASGLVAFIWMFFHIHNHNLLTILLADILEVTFIFLLFKHKRWKNGFPYFNKKHNSDYIDIFIIIVCIFIIFVYFILTLHSQNKTQNIYVALIFFCILFIPIIRKAFILYHKQKLQTQALKDYEKELSETKQKLETAINEKQKLVKSNHEFYHRQEALNKKLDDLMRQQTSLNSTEFSEEYANVLDRINNLSNEYSIKTKSLPTLVKTNIVEIDDMLSYMQSECEKNNIEFILKVDCDLNFILENYISKSQLETLLGDLIRNAIIAIDHSSNDYKSIMVIFGIKDEAYELCIFDSGIPFEINTLLNLGLQPASTHTNEGGTGIGFITTFETINSCNASFIINENTNSNYSKSIEIKFDNKHEYIIISDRKEKITELNQSNRKIILK